MVHNGKNSPQWNVMISWIVLALFVFLPLVSADEPAENSSNESVVREQIGLYVLGEIEVVGQSEKEDIAAKTTVPIENSDTRLKESVLEAVMEQPGIITTVGDKNEPQILLRGFNQERILILLDGVPLSSPYYGDLDTSELPLDSLASIKIVRGNASVLYGPNALGGVLSIVSSKPLDEPFFKGLMSVDQEGNFTARVNHGMAQSGFYYQLSAGIRESDGWPVSGDFDTSFDEEGFVLQEGDGERRNHSAYSQWSVGIKAGYEWAEGELSFSLQHADAEKEIPPATTEIVRVRYWDFPEWKKTSGQIAGRTVIGDNLEFRANLFYHKYDNVLRNYDDRNYSEIRWESTFDDYSAGLLTRLAWAINENSTLRFAIQSFDDNHRAQSDIGDPWEEFDARTHAFLLESYGNITPKTTLTLGAGWEIFDFSSARNIEASDSAVANRTKDVSDYTANVALSYKLADTQSLSFALSRKNRFPTMHQLFSNIEEVAPDDIGTLESENSWQYGLIYEIEPAEQFLMGTSLFYYDIENLIDRPANAELFENVDTATFAGLEAWLSWRMQMGLSATMSYTYVDAEDTSSDAINKDLPYIPEHVFHAAIAYSFPTETALELGFSYNGDSLEYDDDDNPVTIPAFSLVDVNVRQDLFESRLTLIFQVLNLFDENYYREIGYEQQGRLVKVGIRFNV